MCFEFSFVFSVSIADIVSLTSLSLDKEALMPRLKALYVQLKGLLCGGYKASFLR